MILPQLVEMAEELKDRARIVKFNCNKYNKDLGISLGIKVAPTFLLYKRGEQVTCCPG
jgi:thioredoxin 1